MFGGAGPSQNAANSSLNAVNSKCFSGAGPSQCFSGAGPSENAANGNENAVNSMF